MLKLFPQGFWAIPPIVSQLLAIKAFSGLALHYIGLLDGDVAHFCREGQFFVLLIEGQVVVSVFWYVATIVFVIIVVPRFHLGSMDRHISVYAMVVTSIAVGTL